MRWMLIALLIAGCGGGLTASDCDPCVFDHAEADGSNLVCTCAAGSGQQTYARVLETTTACVDNRVAWSAYAAVACR